MITDALTDRASTHPVQKVVLVASAGIENSTDDASNLNVQGGANNVYATQANADPYAPVAECFRVEPIPVMEPAGSATSPPKKTKAKTYSAPTDTTPSVMAITPGI